jgi:catalase (peroxidase I)
MNIMVNEALTILRPIKIKFGIALTWADLIVLAGTTAVEESGGLKIPFCPGRSDALNGLGWKHIQPNGNYSPQSTLEFTTSMQLLNLTDREVVALAARPRSPQLMCRLGFESNTWTNYSEVLSNDYAIALTSEIWEPYKNQYKAINKNQYMLPVDMIINSHLPYRAIAEEHASDYKVFLKDFAHAWSKISNNDRFHGPTGNLCPPFVENDTIEYMAILGGETLLREGTDATHTEVIALCITSFVMAICFLLWVYSMVCRRKIYTLVAILI